MISGGGKKRAWLLAPAVLFLVSVAVTQPPFIGDSLDHATIVADVTKHSLPASNLAEAGHIIWRPLGYIAAPLFYRAIPDRVAWTPALKICYGLILLNLLCGLAATVLIYDVSRRLMGNSLAALAPALLFVWGDAVLSYSRSGMSYVPGLAVLIAGLWWQITGRGGSRAAIWGPAVLYGVAALCWLPYVIAIPAACCARRFLGPRGADGGAMSWQEVLASMVTAGAVTAAAVGVAALAAGVHSAADGMAWLTAAGHGIRPNRQAIRAVMGCSRLFFDLGRDGVYLKRFLFHDPYHPVNAAALIRYSLWKVAFFYVFVGCLVMLGWKSAEGRRGLGLLALAAVPGLLAAIVVFEPSSPERFLPVLPFLLLAVAAGWNAAWDGRGGRVAGLSVAGIALFAVLLPVLNLPGFTGTAGWRRQAAAQVTELRAEAAPQDTVVTVTATEPLEELSLHPFDALNRGNAIHPWWTIDPISGEAASWPRRFAKLVEADWAFGRSVWVERVALDERPADSLLWVEGDNPKVHWRDVPVFFRGLQYDGDTGGADGFLRLARSPANQAALRDAAEAR